jgi:hypothetical protein
VAAQRQRVEEAALKKLAALRTLWKADKFMRSLQRSTSEREEARAERERAARAERAAELTMTMGAKLEKTAGGRKQNGVCALPLDDSAPQRIADAELQRAGVERLASSAELQAQVDAAAVKALVRTLPPINPPETGVSKSGVPRRAGRLKPAASEPLLAVREARGGSPRAHESRRDADASPPPVAPPHGHPPRPPPPPPPPIERPRLGGSPAGGHATAWSIGDETEDPALL